MSGPVPDAILEPISPRDVRFALVTRREIALIDLREEDPFAKGHPLFAAQVSVGRIEVEILDRVPRRDTLIALYDDDPARVALGARRLRALGYSNLRELAGGIAAWRDAGFELFEDVNSYSKAFGELVEARRHTPSLSAQEVRRLIDAKADIVILDARRFEEYATMSIPTGLSAPGAELVARAAAAAPSPETTIIVNCAGRTRSIIGTQSLVNAGLPNRVAALRNGTIGWTLAGQELERGQSRRAPLSEAEDLAEARRRARAVAYRAGVRRLDVQEAAALAADPDRTLYRFDVRPPEDYAAGHIPGFKSAPGGQLVQETDMFAPVRGARVLLADDLGARADMTASWLAQMGFETYVLEGGFDGDRIQGPWAPRTPNPPAAPEIDPATLAQALAARDISLIDLATSQIHGAGHVPGARFALRDDLPAILGRPGDRRPVVLTSPDGLLARFAWADLDPAWGVRVLSGGTAAWIAAGLPIERGLAAPLSPPIDVYKRPYEGTDNSAAAMQAYLDWEYGLVAQLERDGSHGFFVI